MSEELKASKGPYKATYDRKDGTRYVADANGGVVVAGMTEEDANLLAASWSMYQLLERARNDYRDCAKQWDADGEIERRDVCMFCAMRIDEVLKKARGEA